MSCFRSQTPHSRHEWTRWPASLLMMLPAATDSANRQRGLLRPSRPSPLLSMAITSQTSCECSRACESLELSSSRHDSTSDMPDFLKIIARGLRDSAITTDVRSVTLQSAAFCPDEEAAGQHGQGHHQAGGQRMQGDYPQLRAADHCQAGPGHHLQGHQVSMTLTSDAVDQSAVDWLHQGSEPPTSDAVCQAICSHQCVRH